MKSFIAASAISAVLADPLYRDCASAETVANFNGGYGSCATYKTGMYNRQWCKKDADVVSGCLASQTCPECGANENDTTDVLGPGSTPVIRMIEEGGCDNSLWQTIETQEGCLAAKWINPDWNALNNGAVPTEVTAAEGSMFQFGCFYDTQLGTIRFNSDRTSVAKKGQGICAWRFPTSVHYEIMADDMRTCDEIGDHVIASKTECLQAAISEQPNRGGSYKVQEASNVFPYGCSFSGTGQAMFNGEATSGRGLQFVQSSTGELIPNPARPLCRAKTPEERHRERIAAQAARNAEYQVALDEATARLQADRNALAIINLKAARDENDVNTATRLEATITTQEDRITAFIEAQQDAITEFENSALSLHFRKTQAMVDGDSEAVLRFSNEIAEAETGLQSAVAAVRDYESENTALSTELSQAQVDGAVAASELAEDRLQQNEYNLRIANLLQTQLESELAMRPGCPRAADCAEWTCPQWCECYQENYVYVDACNDDSSPCDCS